MTEEVYELRLATKGEEMDDSYEIRWMTAQGISRPPYTQVGRETEAGNIIGAMDPMQARERIIFLHSPCRVTHAKTCPAG